MDILEDGSVVLEYSELGTAVAAVDLSPEHISTSGLAKRLRMAQKASTTTEGGAVELIEEARRAIVRGDAASAELFLDEASEVDPSLGNTKTVIPRNEIDILGDALLNLVSSEREEVIDYLSQLMPEVFKGKGLEPVLADNFFESANRMLDVFFPYKDM